MFHSGISSYCDKQDDFLRETPRVIFSSNRFFFAFFLMVYTLMNNMFTFQGRISNSFRDTAF